jgi:hypothetical protein
MHVDRGKAGPMNAPEAVTVLRSHAGVLAKRLRRTAAGWATVPFSAGAWFEAH